MHFPIDHLSTNACGTWASCSSAELLQHVGDEWLAGNGVEMGAGLRPMVHPRVGGLTIIDKRDEEDFERHFGSPPPYPLVTTEQLATLNLKDLDFVAAHQVVEHISNPIHALIEWIKMIRQGGLLFISIPSQRNAMEWRRQLTPIYHILDDFFLGNGGDETYESRQHIFSFISGVTAMNNEMKPWYATDTDFFVKRMLQETKEHGGHDLHWHTYDMPTIAAVLQVAFWLADSRAERVVEVETGDTLILLYRKLTSAGSLPFITEYQARLSAALRMCCPSRPGTLATRVAAAFQNWRRLIRSVRTGARR